MLDIDTIMHWCGQLLKFLFVDKYGKFQWLGATGIGAILTILATSNNNKKNLRADVLYKTELNVLDRFKDDCANLSSVVWAYNVKLNQMCNNWENNKLNEDVDNVLSEELTVVYKEIRKYNSLVRLDISNYAKSKEVTEFIGELNSLIKTIENAIMNSKRENHVGNRGEASKKYEVVSHANNVFIDKAMEFENYIHIKQIKSLK